MLTLVAAFLVSTAVATLEASVICNNIAGLVPKQQSICNSRPDAMVSIGEGAERALTECQHQFKNMRWNCSLDKDFTSLQLGTNLKVGSREAGFALSIRSAGISHGITQACSNGRLKGCSCDKSKVEGALSDEGWQWGGCSADVEYGTEFARVFVDAGEDKETARSLMNLHNNRAGRKLLRKLVEIECKCHGPSGSCALKTCWMKLPLFRKVGDTLMKRYYRAKKVKSVQLMKHRQSLKLYRTRRDSEDSRPRKADLVFLEDSPNYCEYDKNAGSLGTQGRLCNKTSKEADSCNVLCCGRGYNTHEHVRKWQCDCVFHWCCHVTCKECQEKTEIYSCK
ncbi:protein Wnt-7a-like isoform X2 [Watersipora subatra]|uniref:protein Wnt-7a-like isoform X2 n=1 Tax=Watersipora subatra TaxID=2589382 RepID=UPI00355BE0A1